LGVLNPTPLLRLHADRRRRQLSVEDARASQERQLLALARRAQSTRFGRDHDLAGVRDVRSFQERVPLRTYGELWTDYWRECFPRLDDVTWPGRMPFYAVSSGTSTGAVKHIPCSHDMVRSNRRAALDILVHHLAAMPESRILDGAFFVLGGSTDLKELAPGVRAGDISGIAAFAQPWWSRPFAFPPREVRFLTDWEAKLGRMAPLSLERRIRGLSGAPGWLLVLFEKLASLRPEAGGRIAGLYPELEVLIHGGAGFAPYRQRFERLLDGSAARLREVYPASEGFIAIADREPGEGMRLITDHGLFYEFVPVAELGAASPTRHWAGTIEPGIDYAIVLTTCAGLWAYLLGDVVRFVETRPPRLLVVGRTSYMLSAFGEHVSGELIETCVLAAARTVALHVAEFTVGTEFMLDQGAWGRHAYIVEFCGPAPEAARIDVFGAALDAEMARRNEDYAERRVVPEGLRAPRIEAMPKDGFRAWMKSRGKLGGQHKVPRVIEDQRLLAELRGFARARRAERTESAPA
jgi:hypothetical protein